MPEEKKTYTESEAHRQFAVQYHDKTWDLLEKKDRSRDENEMMLDYAHASLAHWRAAGTAVHHQRGEWLLARVYTILGEGDLALYHAQRCRQVLETNKDVLTDFDFAFSNEALGRAYALRGEKPESKKYIELAQKAGDAIKEKGDREAFFDEFNGGEWNGMK